MRNRIIIVVVLSVSAALIQTITIGVIGSFIASFVLYTIALCTGSLFAIATFSPLVQEDVFITKVKNIAGLTGISNKQIIMGFISGIVIDVLMVAGLVIFYDYFNNAQVVIDAVAKMGVKNSITLIITIIGLVINAIAEELFWRGTLHSCLLAYQQKHNKNNACAVVTSREYFRVIMVSFLFGINHIGIMAGIAPSFPAGLLSLLGITLTGVLWSIMREKTRSIIPSIISHVLVTLGYSGLLVFYFVSYRA